MGQLDVAALSALATGGGEASAASAVAVSGPTTAAGPGAAPAMLGMMNEETAAQLSRMDPTLAEMLIKLPGSVPSFFAAVRGVEEWADALSRGALPDESVEWPEQA